MPSKERARGRNRERSLGGVRGSEFLGFPAGGYGGGFGLGSPGEGEGRGGEQQSKAERRGERDKVRDEFWEEEKRKRESQTDGLLVLGLLSGKGRLSILPPPSQLWTWAIRHGLSDLYLLRCRCGLHPLGGGWQRSGAEIGGGRRWGGVQVRLQRGRGGLEVEVLDGRWSEEERAVVGGEE